MNPLGRPIRLTKTRREGGNRAALPVRAQRGFTAIELVVSLVIGALLLAAGGVAIGSMFNRSAIASELANVNALIANTSLLRRIGGYGAASTNLIPTLKTARGLPPSLRLVGSTVLYHTWDGRVLVRSDGNTFNVTLTLVPRDACIELATKVSANTRVAKTRVAGTTYTAPVTLAQAVAKCGNPTGTVYFYTRD